MSDIIRRQTTQSVRCRGCDEELGKGVDVVYTYSSRNRGQHIFFCIPCSRKIGRLAHPRKRKLIPGGEA